MKFYTICKRVLRWTIVLLVCLVVLYQLKYLCSRQLQTTQKIYYFLHDLSYGMDKIKCHSNSSNLPMFSSTFNDTKTWTLRAHIAIGLAITSRGSTWINDHAILTSFPFFRVLLPSFCKTASARYGYHFFIAFDHDDAFFTSATNRCSFTRLFQTMTSSKRDDADCPGRSIYELHFIRCDFARKPAWAQNDAMLAAYMSNMQYFYRINDDTILQSAQWTEVFTNTLHRMDPPNVGVVGPAHTGGNLQILTYDFVHSIHIDIHGYYYPRQFSDWGADDWITHVYRPERVVKVKEVKVNHTRENGRRYVNVVFDKNELKRVVLTSRAVVDRYVESLETVRNASKASRQVLVTSLYGNNPRYTYGAVRNLQLHRILLPDWTVRIYMYRSRNNATTHLAVPELVVNKLRLLGAQIVYVNDSYVDVDPRLWRYDVINDLAVNSFILFDTKMCFDTKLVNVVTRWTTNRSEKTLCYIREHQTLNNHTMLYVGANRDVVSKLYTNSSSKFMLDQLCQMEKNVT